ncbi:hypothetical protein [Spirosoma sp.]|uniref:hypothetical protein n=1 Tax=Spirosoma sp. TaxID=1899569 RepID=UPI003B39FED0
MKRDLRIDHQQVYIGDSSTLTLEIIREAKDKPGSIFQKIIEPDTYYNSLFLLFDNLSSDHTALIEYRYNPPKVNGDSPTLTFSKLYESSEETEKQVSKSASKLFRRLVAGKTGGEIKLPLKEEDPVNISFLIQEWDMVGTYVINAFIDRPDAESLSAWTSRDLQSDYDFPTVNLKVTEESAQVVNVSLQETNREATDDQLLWIVIRNRTLNFNDYRRFMDRVLCSDKTNNELAEYKNRVPFNRTASYSLLKVATELYLMQECGLVPSEINDFYKPISKDPKGDGQRTRRSNISRFNISRLRDEYLSKLETEGGRTMATLPYFETIRENLKELPLKEGLYLPNDCYGILQSRLTSPPLLELIWSYWHEEGGLVQTLNALSLRFQNVRRGIDRDPLANLAIDPLRPLGNLLWGYIEDERNRLTINRRNLEYQYEYGISLIGKAVQSIPVAEHRTNFLRGFHELLRVAVEFYQQANFTTVIPDGFPMLNHLREVHLMLAEGAHNQYGDLPWTARVEMMTQQWLLARPEVREFLGGRIMVPYTEPWMDRVDNMKQLQGWNPTNVTHFHDLGVFGEQLLLSIRYGNWNNTALSGQNAANWAHYWRAEIQRYIHAYKAVTGVDLASDIVDTRISLPANEDRYQQPSQLIERQVAMRQNGQVRPRQINGPSINAQLPPNGQLIRREYNG